MIMEAGPFTTSYNLDYEPLQDLLSCLLLDAPDVVILTGPFVIFYLIMLLKTLAVKITASGRILSPILVCRCIPGGYIATWDFATYPCRVYLCMSIFHGWSSNAAVGKAGVEALNFGATYFVPLLLLDSYRCHMMASVVTWINELDVEFQHIPGGFTNLCQPVDVRVAKPLKDDLRNQWESWMIE